MDPLIFISRQILNDEIHVDEVGEKINMKNLKTRQFLEYPYIDGRITLKWILKKRHSSVGAEFISLRIRNS